MSVASVHCPVLLEATLARLNVRPGGTYVDGTLGGGGHARGILRLLHGRGKVYGIDRDAFALARTTRTLAEYGDLFEPIHGNYADMKSLLAERGGARVDGVLLDLGMSSDQLDENHRGFSFRMDGPLDMRMDSRQQETAADWLRRSSSGELTRIFREYGEEPRARAIADAIVRARTEKPLTRTHELADLVTRVKGGRRGRTHPATQVFQALRMAVNREWECVPQGVETAIRITAPGGRVAVISFHSVEDRWVKEVMKAHMGRWISLQAGGQRREGERPWVRRMDRKPVEATPAEIAANPRARSAKLRVVEIEDES